ncbi:hypothetical protein PAE2592 [Pyrobaculum aerophilum str. IM2]|uniref:Uncharacterized protein n=2 Tax=Pyrobaculum aerophilum TaxID=13773 RepID=Q8ZUV4_PYRAE|nr:hypothetical protein [Pyrobaculum aerophilum]AAL64302.1 hypothetical protein PAE2592 [Pyrobaculum aerophilum str. IM2]HII47649.1 hypothetical protein [Pyrobaculum aerophilum]
MDFELRGELEAPVGEVEIIAVMQCMGWRYVGEEGGYAIFEPNVDKWLLPKTRLYIKRRLGNGKLLFEGFGLAPGSRLEFVLTVDGKTWTFRGRQRGVVNLLGRGYVELLAREIAKRVLNCIFSHSEGQSI